MNFTQPMIRLVQDIRRHSPPAIRPQVKFTNPDLRSILIPLYKQADDISTQVLIEELFELAGPEWMNSLTEATANPAKKAADKGKWITTRVYRGQVLQQVESGPKPSKGYSGSSKRVYRGQVISSDAN